ncbi:Cytokinin biosynthesis 2 [Hyphodiscus hymeniophilus]|uniref:Cytokinin biosynthesis 2 n=1 Tax=Hyphodiscus hymeniophilus TaxID=353542 RepID=A0A9P6VJ21_9HELO|nr:Cytokinin biosynthesis 2 [Hyphodiscus hymeniophilus]
MGVHVDVTSLLKTSLVAAVVGVLSHLGYFIRGEHHMQSARYLAVFLIAPAILFVTLVRLADNASYIDVAKTTAVATLSYFTALVTSILTYRVFFHPLRRFPGPFSYRLSKLVHVASLVEHSRNFEQAEQLRQKYGDIVRVGPNELTIFTPEGLEAISGVGSKCTKAGCDLPTHEKRRKVWDRAFSAK